MPCVFLFLSSSVYVEIPMNTIYHHDQHHFHLQRSIIPLPIASTISNIESTPQITNFSTLSTHSNNQHKSRTPHHNFTILMYSTSNSHQKDTNMNNMKCSEISHFSHRKHNLRFEYSQFPFKCDGCKEIGIGSRYKCSICDYDLHMHCAIYSPTLFHPFYPKCSFHFLSKPQGDTPRYCNACEKGVNGFVYHCMSCGFDLHPCCAKLPMVLDDGEIKLYLHRKVSSPCHRCGQKGRSWSYRSSCKKYNLHVACVREMIVESWHHIYIGRSNGRTMVENGIPSLKNTLQTTHNSRSKGKVRKCCEIAGMAVQIVVSAVLGDPTALIAGIIGSLMSRA